MNTSFKRTLAVLLTLIMTLSIIPFGMIGTSAYNYGPNYIAVGSEIYNWPFSNLASGLSWDESTQTLTMDGYNGGAIAFLSGGTPDEFDITINLVGNNTINTDNGFLDSAYGVNTYSGLYSLNECTIQGTGTLNINTECKDGEDDIDAAGIFVNNIESMSGKHLGRLTVKGDASVNINMHADSSAPDYISFYGILAGALSVEENAVLDINVKDETGGETSAEAVRLGAYATGSYGIGVNTSKYVSLRADSKTSASVADCDIYLSSYSSLFLNSNSRDFYDGEIKYLSGSANDFNIYDSADNFDEDLYYNAYISSSGTTAKITAGDIADVFGSPRIGYELKTKLDSEKYYGLVSWTDADGNSIPDGTIAESSKVYNAEIRLIPKPGYGFNGSDMTSEILSSAFPEASEQNFSLPTSDVKHAVLSLKYNEAKNDKITKVDLKLASPPYVGETASMTNTVIENGLCTLSSRETDCGWYDENNSRPMVNGLKRGIFQVDKKYYLRAYLTVKDSALEFDRNCAVSIENCIVESTRLDSDGRLYVLAYCYPRINRIDITELTMPAAGQIANEYIVYDPSYGYQHTSRNWYNKTDKCYMKDAGKETFEEDKFYEYRVTFGTYAISYYSLFADAEKMIISVNGKKDDPGISVRVSDDHKKCYVVYDYGELEHTHTYSEELRADNRNHFRACTKCGAQIEAEAHTSSDWIVDKPATVSEDGMRHKECTVCKYVLITEKINKLSPTHEHSFSAEWKTDKDNHWKECACGAKSENAKHVSSGWIIDKSPTTSEEGAQHKECTICKYVLVSETIDKLPPVHEHSFSVEWKTDNDNHWKECACGEKSEKSKHVSSEWITDKEPTVSEEGAKHKECTVCKYVLASEKIDKLPPVHEHSFSAEWKTDNDTHWKECACGEKSENSKHVSSDWIVDKPATVSEDGVRHKECTVCGYVLENGIIAKISEDHKHVYSDEWKSDSENHWKECECGAKSDTAKHTESDWIIDKEATKEADGEKHIECTVCKAVIKTEKIEKIADESVLRGDIDGNGKVNAADARLALRISAKLESPTDLQIKSGDLDADGKISAKEARMILRFAARLEKEI